MSDTKVLTAEEQAELILAEALESSIENSKQCSDDAIMLNLQYDVEVLKTQIASLLKK